MKPGDQYTAGPDDPLPKPVEPLPRFNVCRLHNAQGVASYDAAGVAVGHARPERAQGVRVSPSAVHPWLFRGFGTVLETQRQHAGTSVESCNQR